MKVLFMPAGRSIEVKPGTTVMHAALKAGVHIRSRCGHQAGCLMCKVTVENEHAVMGKTDKEKRKLGTGSVRLACQTKILKDVTIHVPEDPLKKAVRLQLEKQQKGEEPW